MIDSNTPRTSVTHHVLERLKAEKISMRSRFGVAVERIGLEGIGISMFLIAVLAVSLILFWAKSEGLFAYSQFGPVGIRAFLEAVPYPWFVIATLAVLALFLVLKHTAEEYKLPAEQIALVLVAFVFVIGSVTTLIGLSDQIVNWLTGKQLLADDLVEHHGQVGVVGMITTVSTNQFTMLVGRDSVIVQMSERTVLPVGQVILPGDRVLVVSQSAVGNTITAVGVQKLHAMPVHRVPIIDPMYQPHSS